MKKRVLFVFLSVIVLSGCIATSYDASEASAEEVLVSSFKSSQASVLESTISSWVKLSDSFYSSSQISKEMDRIVKLLDPDKNTISSSSQTGSEANKELLYAVKGKKSYSIAIDSVKNEGKGETYAVIDVSIDGDYNELANEKKVIEALFDGKGNAPKTYSCIIGTYKGKLTESQMRGKTQTILKAIKANKVEGLENDEMTSISAFSGKISSFIVSNDKKVNVQVAMRYSSYDDKTYIWIASPLIPVEY